MSQYSDTVAPLRTCIWGTWRIRNIIAWNKGHVESHLLLAAACRRKVAPRRFAPVVGFMEAYGSLQKLTEIYGDLWNIKGSLRKIYGGLRRVYGGFAQTAGVAYEGLPKVCGRAYGRLTEGLRRLTNGSLFFYVARRLMTLGNIAAARAVDREFK